MTPAAVVLDASSLLAVLLAEPGAERVAPHVDAGEAAISTVNLAEVLGRFARDGKDAGLVEARLRASPLEIVPFTGAHALTAGRLIAVTRPAGLSLGDRACLALALERGAVALTADDAWVRVPHGVRVELIR